MVMPAARVVQLFHFDKRASLALQKESIKHPAWQEIASMNTQTLILTVMVFWLIMGLAFLSAHSEVKRTGGTLADTMRNNETFFFIISIVVGLAAIAFKVA
jgi:hypothetical protein